MGVCVSAAGRSALALAHGRPQRLPWLAVRFADTSCQNRSAVEHLRESQARAHARAQQLAEQQRLLQQILGQVPAAIATLSGPAHQFSFFNDDHQAIVAGRAHLGQPLAAAVPEVVEQLDRVLATGEPFVSRAVPAPRGGHRPTRTPLRRLELPGAGG